MALLSNTGTSRQRPIRGALSRFLTSKLRGILEVSEGQRPAEVFYPYKHLPVKMIDTELEDGIVILKGTIVSALSQMQVDDGETALMPRASGTIYSGISQTTSSAISENIDDSFYGYDESVVGLLTIANGGVQVQGTSTNEQYTANDVTVGTIDVSGSLTVAGYASPGRQKNLPIGVVTTDVYQDIRGKYLNYDQLGSDKVGILSDWYIEIPFVVDADMSDDDTHTAYNALQSRHAFLWVTAKNLLIPGALFKSDRYGKFKPQFTTVSTATHPTTAYKTAQTVARLIAIDCRWPKDQMHLVDTYPGSLMPGTETGGLPSHLFNFVYDWYYYDNSNTAPTIAQCVNLVTGLQAGVARLQLEVGA